MTSTQQTRTRPDYRSDRGRRFVAKPKVCAFCAEKIAVDYKDIGRLRRYISDRGKIEPRRRTGACARHQRRIALAIKRARYLALLPDAPSHLIPKEVRITESKTNGEVKDAETNVPTQEISKKA
jgi:small subunit ribosomal protein S18